MREVALLLTDTHLMPATIEINRSIWTQAVDICIKRDIKKVYHLGDVFDSRKAQTQEMLIVLDELLTIVSDAGIDIVILPGNHDKTSYMSEDSFLHVYRYHPNVTIVRDGLVEYEGDMSITLCPFFDEKSGKYGEKLKQIPVPKSDIKILLTHIGVNEAIMNGGSIIEDHLDEGVFDPFDKVKIGHFHDYQELKKGKIVYIGSAFQENFGEDNRKGFQILKSDGSLEFIKADFPEYKKIVIDIDSTTKEEMIELKKEHENSANNIRFVFKGAKEKLATIDKGEYVALGIDIKTEEFDATVVDYKNQQVTTFNNETILAEWDDFTEEDKENQEKGKEYLEKLLN